jgi:isoleucyl-tRNA synthetase
MPFDPVDPKQSFPDLERGILDYWRLEDIFKRSMSQRKDCDQFSFYDGPPFATGLPHYGHILAGTIKDVIPRYQTMRGKYVERRFGWDCHGLPVEYEIEKEHGIQSKRDIEAMGTKAFNDLCRNAVQRYTEEWRRTVERFGRFVDMDHDYRTMDPDYMESIWWVFKSLHEKGLIYEGHKPMHVCPRCVTPLSNFEVTQGYKDITDQSVVAKFEMVEEDRKQKSEGSEKTYFLAWTTTPWTLPGNLFLAINPEVQYFQFKRNKDNNESIYISADTNLIQIAGNNTGEFGKRMVDGETYSQDEKEFTLVDRKPILGKDLIGIRYKPLFPYFAKDYPDAFRVVSGDFVTTEEGTGIVHIAPGFGEDDFKVGMREKVKLLQHVSMEGQFTNRVTDFAGEDVKPKDEPMKMDRKIVEFLKKQGSVFEEKIYRHSYPHCWRCDSPLLNYATSSWFVKVEQMRETMLKANVKTEWVPAHLRDGRFGKWLEGARDWAISRDRYWGTPLPIWQNKKTGNVEVLGSRDELMQKAPHRFTKITVMRHAQAENNVKQIYQGVPPGVSLTKEGVEQAKASAKRVADGMIPVSAIYASPLNRAQETAAHVARLTKKEIVTDVRLKEVDFGDWEGKHISFDDLTFVRERREHKLGLDQAETLYHFEGMETWESVEKRCRSFLEETLSNHRGEHIVIVTHADAVMNFLHIFSQLPKKNIVHRPYPKLGSIQTFYWDHETNAQMDLHKETVDTIHFGEQESQESVHMTMVRHGQTDWNRDELCQGQEADRALTDLGKKQAQETAMKLKGQSFDCIVTSDLQRARETAEILSKELGVQIAEKSALFRERKMGEWVGAHLKEIKENYMPRFPSGEFGITQVSPPGGETLSQFLMRIDEARTHLLHSYAGKNVLVVAHGGVMQGFEMVANKKPYYEAASIAPKNAEASHFALHPALQRIPDVLDCWFESGSMPYAQGHYPFDGYEARLPTEALAKAGGTRHEKNFLSKLETRNSKLPKGFPADFIAEGLDQTRGWFYTLMVLSTALFDEPAFKNVIVNGTVLAEDGKKMSKRLKNYPEPTEIVEKYGADAVRFALMRSPAVRGEDLRISEKLIEDTLSNVLLPFWNSYSFFVTYANAAGWEPAQDFSLASAKGSNELDRWILAKTQDLVNRMTQELEHYDLSATCDELAESIDGLTNWYIRLSRRRFAGKDSGQKEAFDTLYRVLLTISQLLAPVCPFITDEIFLNLVPSEHGSIHLSDWPHVKALTPADEATVALMDTTRTIVGLGLSLRSDAKIRIRQPLATLRVALPPSDHTAIAEVLIKEELNVKNLEIVKNGSSLGSRIALVDARKVGPRVGGKVQDIIKAGKSGGFEEKKDGSIVILGERLSQDEVKIAFVGAEGQNIASDICVL